MKDQVGHKLIKYLPGKGFKRQELSAVERQLLMQRWCSHFTNSQSEDWHVFAIKEFPAIEGSLALHVAKSLYSNAFYVVQEPKDEEHALEFLCHSKNLPEFEAVLPQGPVRRALSHTSMPPGASVPGVGQRQLNPLSTPRYSRISPPPKTATSSLLPVLVKIASP